MIKAAYNAIWTIIDLFIKYTYFLLYKEESIVEYLAYTFQQIIVTIYSMLEVVVSD